MPKRRDKPKPIDYDQLAEKLRHGRPAAHEAEAALLGAMIENPACIGEVVGIIRSAMDFHQPSHQAIYQAIIDLWNSNTPIGMVILRKRLDDSQALTGRDGTDYLIELAENAVDTSETTAVAHAQVIVDKAVDRALMEAGGRIMLNAHDGGLSTAERVDAAQRLVFDLSDPRNTSEPRDAGSLLDETFTLMEQRRGSGEGTITGLRCGFYRIDEMLSGLQPGEMIIIAARPSMGKTSLMLNMAEYMAMDGGVPVAVFSLEMGKQQLAGRILSSRSGVDAQRIRRNMISTEELDKLRAVVEETRSAPMHIDDTPGLSIMQLRASARRMAMQYGIQAIFVDYLQLMTSPGAESRQQEVSEISRGIKALARELNIPVVCLSQLNRNPEGRESKRPMLSDLRDSGSIEQDTDVAMLIHREDYYAKKSANGNDAVLTHTAQVIIAKQRNGPTGVVDLHFDGNTTKFNNLSKVQDYEHSGDRRAIQANASDNGQGGLYKGDSGDDPPF